jgi:alanine racemase
MKTLYRDTYAKVNLPNLNKNVETIYEKEQKPLIAIIKANAYGMGYKHVANAIKDNPHIKLFAVATLKEAVDLRELGVKQDILILGAIPLEDLEIAIKEDISLPLFSFDFLKEILANHHFDRPVKVHIAIDSGMNRIGFKSREEYEQAMRMIDPDKIAVEGIFTHFATADEPDNEAQNVNYEKQLALFKSIVGNNKFKYIHCDNSAAMMFHHSNFGNLGRIGIALYGIDPRGVDNDELKPVMSLMTKVAMLKRVPKGEKIGYGATYTTAEDGEYIATLPIGYADGFIRANQGRHVYINGRLYPIVGRVCMDQCMVKVDENVHVHDDVEIFGDHLSINDMAKDLNTIPYEVLCLISPRVERVYEED